MSRAVILDSFGGTEALNLREVVEPHADAKTLRVHVIAAGLNPMDWIITADKEAASRFGLNLPVGFGTDYAGVIDEVGEGVTAYAVGDHVFGSALSRAIADYIVIDPTRDSICLTPVGVDDLTASTLDIASRTASAALAAIGIDKGDTVLIGGAAGGVGVFAVQLARLAGAKVIGTGSESSFDYLHSLGAKPVAYGAGLSERVQAIAPHGVHAAVDLFGTEVADIARELGVPDDRITTIAAQVPGIQSVSGANAVAGTTERVAALVAAGKLTVPIAGIYPVEQIREAAKLQATRHVHGKIVITL